jgi:hypothetical protein
MFHIFRPNGYSIASFDDCFERIINETLDLIKKMFGDSEFEVVKASIILAETISSCPTSWLYEQHDFWMKQRSEAIQALEFCRDEADRLQQEKIALKSLAKMAWICKKISGTVHVVDFVHWKLVRALIDSISLFSYGSSSSRIRQRSRQDRLIVSD